MLESSFGARFMHSPVFHTGRCCRFLRCEPTMLVDQARLTSDISPPERLAFACGITLFDVECATMSLCNM